MAKIMGGHALMLKLAVPAVVSDCALRWIAASPETRSSKLDKAHMTLLFVGRDLDEEHADHIIRAGRYIASEIPAALTSKGPLSMFGGKKDHLVALLEKTTLLERLRSQVATGLKHYGVPIKQDFSFNPHLTMALGRPGDVPPTDRPPGQVFQVLGVEVKLGSARCDFMPRGIS